MSKSKARRSPRGGCFVNGRFYRGGCFLPKHGDVVSYDACCIASELSLVTLGDHTYALAMAATMAGSKALRHRKVLRSRSLRAVARLVGQADSAGDYRAHARLHEIHQRTLQGVLSLAGS